MIRPWAAAGFDVNLGIIERITAGGLGGAAPRSWMVLHVCRGSLWLFLQLNVMMISKVVTSN